MMSKSRFSVGVLLQVCLLGAPAWAQQAAPAVPASALRYHQALLRRPNAGYLFERFYNAWLEKGTLAGLEQYLTQQAATGGAAEKQLLAFLHAKKGDDTQALSVLREATKADPSNAELWYHCGRYAARLLDFEAASVDLMRALGAGAKDALRRDTLKLNGRILARMGQTQAALASWQTLLRDHPEDMDLQEELIEIQLQEGLFEEALATSDALLEKTKEPYQKMMRALRRADILDRAGKGEAALAAYSELLGSSGHASWVEREIVAQIERIYRREDDVTGLRDHLGTLLDADAGRVLLRQKHAGVLAELGDLDGAKTAWQDLLARMPEDRAIREAHVRFLRRNDLNADALAALLALSEATPEDDELRIQLAEVQFSEKDMEAGQATVAAFVARHATEAYAHVRAAQLLHRFEAVGAAEALLRQGLDTADDTMPVQESLAELLLRSEDAAKQTEGRTLALALGKDASAQRVIQLASLLQRYQAVAEALQLVEAARTRLGENALLISRQVQLLMALDRSEEALGHARQLLANATTSSALQQALDQVLAAARKANKLAVLQQELTQKQAQLLVPERCLLAELMD